MIECRSSHATKLLLAGAAIFSACDCVRERAKAQGYAPEDVLRHMKVAEGLEVELFAAEPLVRQPVAIEFDDRGRLWVIQYLQYPNPEGLRRVKVDRYSRTQYDRVPEPPPHGPRGADRITIVEDLDGDGRADASHDFVAGLNLTTGLAFGQGGVFVLNVPYLLFYPDRDGNDVPDGDPEVLLTGFGMEDAHSVANSLTWGPDGWLYGCQGSTVTANIRGIEFQQGVWRYHPVTRKFELFCEGGGNSWGLDFNAAGELLYSTNFGGYVMLHGTQGAYLWKSFGKHGALHNPHAYGYFDHVRHENFRGGHVTAGGVVYQGNSFPAEFRGSYIAADLLGHAVRWHTIAPRGSTYQSADGGELLLADDTWFAPCDVTVGPDGAVFVADWHDRRTAHPDPDADWDRSNGRIYRIQAKGGPALVADELPRHSNAALLTRIADSNEWHARRARRLLAENSDATVVAHLKQCLRTSGEEGQALAALWTLYTCGGFDETLAAELLTSPHDAVRSWTVRFLGDAPRISAKTAARLDLLAENEPSAGVRSQLAATARRLPAEQALPIVNSILLRDLDLDDPYIPLLLWWAIERHAVAAPGEVLRRFAAPAAWQSGLTREAILPRLMRRYAAEGAAASLAACARLLAAAPARAHDVLLAALDEGLRERGLAHGGGAGDLLTAYATAGKSQAQVGDAIRAPGELLDLAATRWRAEPNDIARLRLAARLGLSEPYEHALAVAVDSASAEPIRLAMLGVLAEFALPDSVAALLSIAGDASETVQLAVLAVLGRLADPSIATALLQRYPTLSDAVRAKARGLLLARKEWARAFLEGVERGEFAAAEVPIDQVRQVALHGDVAMDTLVRTLWGNVRGGTPEEKLAEVRRLNNDLRAGRGNPAAGRELFKKHCATCHQLFGEGNRVGPDLTTANRQDRDYLLVSIVDPSAVIRKEYLSYVAQTTDGRVVTGLIVEQTPVVVTLLTTMNERIEIARGDLEALEESRLSLMPENAYKELAPQPLRDLFSYLQSQGK